jgi:hypothetical protein
VTLAVNIRVNGEMQQILKAARVNNTSSKLMNTITSQPITAELTLLDQGKFNRMGGRGGGVY